MSLAASMKSLVEDIQTSAQDRRIFVKDTTKDVKELLVRFDKEQEDIVKELRRMADEIKNFLSQGEKARKEDFAVMIKDIAVQLNDISKWQKDVRRDAKELIKEYATDQKKAREYWLSLSKGKKPGQHPKKEKEGKKEEKRKEE